jgi:hypothetical protein
MLIRLCQTAPPHLVGKAERPTRVVEGQADQAVTPLFFARMQDQGW